MGQTDDERQSRLRLRRFAEEINGKERGRERVRGTETKGDGYPTETNIEKRAGRDVLSPILSYFLFLSLSRTHNGSKQRPREQIRHVFKYNTDSLASRQFGEWGCRVAEATPKRPLLLTSARARIGHVSRKTAFQSIASYYPSPPHLPTSPSFSPRLRGCHFLYVDFSRRIRGR